MTDTATLWMAQNWFRYVFIVLSLLVAEIIFYKFLKGISKCKENSWITYTFWLKLLSLFLGWAIVFCLFSIAGLLVDAFHYIGYIIMGIIIFVIYLGINYFIAKKFGKEETKKEQKERLERKELRKQMREALRTFEKVKNKLEDYEFKKGGKINKDGK